MKTTNARVLTGIAFAFVLFGTPAFPAEKINLSALKGKYSGSVIQEGPGGTLSGTATVVVKVPRTGSSATISYAATISDGVGTTVLPTAIRLIANNSLSVTDLLVGIAGTNNAKPGNGAWTQRKRTLTIDATNGEGITLRGTAVAKDLRKRRKLTLTLVSEDGVDTTTFTTKLRSRLPRR